MFGEDQARPALARAAGGAHGQSNDAMAIDVSCVPTENPMVIDLSGDDSPPSGRLQSAGPDGEPLQKKQALGKGSGAPGGGGGGEDGSPQIKLDLASFRYLVKVGCFPDGFVRHQRRFSFP